MMPHTRRVKLPSGRSIEVTYHDKAETVARDLTACPSCRSHLVYPVAWEEAAVPNWEVVLRCPNCEWTETGLFDQATVDRFDVMLDKATESVVADLFEMTRSNMTAEADRFAAALAADGIRPEDF